MLNRTDQEIAACRRLLADKDFSVFMNWVDRNFDDILRSLVTCDDLVAIRFSQGQAQALSGIKQALSDTFSVMERRR